MCNIVYIDFMITCGTIHITPKIIDLQKKWYLINPTNLRLDNGVRWYDRNVDQIERRDT